MTGTDRKGERALYLEDVTDINDFCHRLERDECVGCFAAALHGRYPPCKLTPPLKFVMKY